jgi:DNA polymerase-3 subunit delta'
MTMLGHEGPWREWREALAGARMHHAWLLTGKRGVGKMTFAMAAARALVAEPGVQQPTGPHPDVMVLTHLPKDEKEERKRDDGKPFELKRNVTIAQIREVHARLATRPTLGSRRAIVIDPADDLEKPAQNALLKSLEEPPAGTYFLLVAHRPARLLPTIRSRCRTLRFPDASDEAVARLLAEHASQTVRATRAAAIAAAGGSPGAALAFVDQELGPLDALMRTIVREGDRGFALRGKLAEEIGARPDRERIAAALDLARATLAGRVDAAAREDLPRIADAHAELARLTAQATTYNFDPGLLVMEIGGLLASAAPASDRAHA